MRGKFPPPLSLEPALGLGGGAKATPGRPPRYIKRRGGRGAALLHPLTLAAPLSSTTTLYRLGEALQFFSSTTTTTPSCCWDSEGIYHTSAARWNGERTDFIDTVRAAEYGSAAGLQHQNDRLHQPRDLISLRLWIYEG